MRPCSRRPGTSAAVSTATTPGTARAAVVSMRADERARHAGEAQRPVEHAGRDEVAHERLLAQRELAALVARLRLRLDGRPDARGLATPDGGHQRDRVDDRDVPGAAAQVAGQRAGDGLAVRGGLAAQERLGLHHDARASSSRTARRRWPRTRRPRASRRAAGSPSIVSTTRPAARSAGRAQETTAWPSTMTVHAPQDPSGAQPSFIERRPHRSRRTWSSDSPGSTSSVDRPAVQREVHRTPSQTPASDRLALCHGAPDLDGRNDRSGSARAVWPEPSERPGIRTPGADAVVRRMCMRRLGLERDIVDEVVRDLAADRCRSLGVRLPTFAQLADPDTIPADITERLAGRRPRRPRPAEPVPRPLVQRRLARRPDRRARAPGPAGVADRRRLAHRHRAGRPLPDDRLAQGDRGLRVPRAAPRHRPVRPDRPARGLAVHRQLLPGRRGDQPDHGLPRRRGPARGHEPRAVRMAGALGGGPGGHHPHARHGVQRQGDLRRVRGPGPRPGHRDLQPVQRVREPRRPLRDHRAGAGARLRARGGGAAGRAGGGLRLGDGLRRARSARATTSRSTWAR